MQKGTSLLFKDTLSLCLLGTCFTGKELRTKKQTKETSEQPTSSAKEPTLISEPYQIGFPRVLTQGLVFLFGNSNRLGDAISK